MTLLRFIRPLQPLPLPSRGPIGGLISKHRMAQFPGFLAVAKILGNCAPSFPAPPRAEPAMAPQSPELFHED